jgi:hypothetical protein
MLQRDEDLIRGELVLAKILEEFCVGRGRHVYVREARVLVLRG